MLIVSSILLAKKKKNILLFLDSLYVDIYFVFCPNNILIIAKVSKLSQFIIGIHALLLCLIQYIFRHLKNIDMLIKYVYVI